MPHLIALFWLAVFFLLIPAVVAYFLVRNTEKSTRMRPGAKSPTPVWVIVLATICGSALVFYSGYLLLLQMFPRN